MRILVIEDEPRMQELLRQGLYEHGFTVMSAGDGVTGFGIAIAHEFDVLVLDIGLPQMDGLALIQKLKVLGRTTPVLMLTARDTEDDIIRGLECGADDYLTKPFSFAELVARLRSLTRIHRQEGDGVIEVEDVVVDRIRRSVTRNLVPIELTRQEFLLLVSLMHQANECVPRRTLMESVWGSDRTVGTSALDVLVNSLRSKLDIPFCTKLIGTVRGTGYIFQDTAATVKISQ